MKLTESQVIFKKLTEGSSRFDDMDLGTIKSSTGKFYVGDPCYALPDEIYYGIWDDKYNFEDGLIETDTEDWLVHGTAYGDGSYPSSEGTFGVDSGTLSVIPTSLLDEDKLYDIDRLGKIIPGESAHVSWKGNTGTFIIEIKNPDLTFDIVTGDDSGEEDYEFDEYDSEMYPEEEEE